MKRKLLKMAGPVILLFYMFLSVFVSNCEPIKPSKEALSLQDAFVQVAEKISKSVVHISTESRIKVRGYGFFEDDYFSDALRQFFGLDNAPQREYKRQGLGTGMIVSSDGYILTNFHVIRDVIGHSGEIKVVLPNRKKYIAKVAGYNKKNDLAVLKIAANNLAFVDFGDSDKVRVGEWVIAVGNPFGYDTSVTSGIVSAKRKSSDFGEDSGLNTLPDLIQTDAAINPGNSGGPLSNIYGEVIGISEAISTPTGANVGIGLAIPSNVIKSSLNAMMKGAKFTKSTPWLGISAKKISGELVSKFKIKSGILVEEIDEGSPAEYSGINIGDIILKIDNKITNNAEDLTNEIAKKTSGETILLTIIRKGSEIVKKVQLAEFGESGEEAIDPSKTFAWGDIGITACSITETLVKKYGLTAKKGVVIIDVERDSISDSAEIEEGDVIEEIEHQKLENIEDFKKISKSTSKQKSVMLLVNKRGNSSFIVLPLE